MTLGHALKRYSREEGVKLGLAYKKGPAIKARAQHTHKEVTMKNGNGQDLANLKELTKQIAVSARVGMHGDSKQALTEILDIATQMRAELEEKGGAA